MLLLKLCLVRKSILPAGDVRSNDFAVDRTTKDAEILRIYASGASSALYEQANEIINRFLSIDIVSAVKVYKGDRCIMYASNGNSANAVVVDLDDIEKLQDNMLIYLCAVGSLISVLALHCSS